MSKLFTPAVIAGMELRNRIAMSPMCMYSCSQEDGRVTPWHNIHYASRALGQAGLIIVEATAVAPVGRISARDLGLWEDGQIDGFQELVKLIHDQGAKAGIQLAHAGRKTMAAESGVAPSSAAFPGMPEPRALTLQEIDDIVAQFASAAQRAAAAGFDVIEIHAAHGYLLNQFLSPLSNFREDEYGGSRDNRFRLLGRVITAVKEVWTGPLFARISANEYHPDGNTMNDILYYVREMKRLGVDLIDCSSGGVVPADIRLEPGYQVPYSEEIRSTAGISTGAVGLITTGKQAEEILDKDQADLIFIGRELLRDPFWPRTAAKELGVPAQAPKQYERAW